MSGAGTVVRPVSPNTADGAAPVPACPNCGGTRVDVFCATCGERQPSHADHSMRHVAAEAYGEFVNVDGRLWRSVVALLSKPGLLTREYFAGRRGRYLRPLSLFVLLNLAFFVVQPYTGLFDYSHARYVGLHDKWSAASKAKEQELDLPHQVFVQRFDAEIGNQKRSMLLVSVPLFAVALLLLYALSGRTYVEHLVFSVHVYGFLMFYLTAIGTLLGWVVRGLEWLLPFAVGPLGFLRHNGGVMVLLAVGMVAYLNAALRRYYGSASLPAFARAVVLCGVFLFLLVAFSNNLFYTTLWAM